MMYRYKIKFKKTKKNPKVVERILIIPIPPDKISKSKIFKIYGSQRDLGGSYEYLGEVYDCFYS